MIRLEQPGPTIEPHAPAKQRGRPPRGRGRPPHGDGEKRGRKPRTSATIESIEALGTTEAPV
ncbi:MAG: hypothetical protein ACYC6V_08615, partial [Bacillota bacterium]